MSTVMKASEFIKKLIDIANNYKTLYVMGCFGAPMTSSNKTRYCNNHEYNAQRLRTNYIKNASSDTFGFDCVCLIKGVLWGWCGDKNKTYGGASYAVNGVPDINADVMFERCSDISSDFSKIEVGEAVYTPGHIGVYIGDGLAVECTPAWKNKVQITACNCAKSGYNTRNWKKHGKLPYIQYDVKSNSTTTKNPKKTVAEIAKEVMDGKWGNGAARKSALTKAGYDYDAVQNEVEKLVAASKTTATTKKSITTIAKEVIAGKWYTGAARKSALTKAGYDYDAVQKKVNEILETSKKKSVTAVAKEVIAGKWGNGTARKNALKKAGYTDSEIKAIQNKVNELL